MAPRPPQRWRAALAAVGYAATAVCCLIGTTGVFLVLGTIIAIDLIRGLIAGDFRARLKRQRW